MTVISKGIDSDSYYLRKDYLGRAVLVVRDSVALSVTLTEGEVLHTSPVRDAKKSDTLSNVDYDAICDVLRKEHDYVFKRTWFGKYVLCIRRRYDMNIILSSLKFKTLETLLNIFTGSQRTMCKVFKGMRGSYIHLTVPAKDES